MVNDNKIVVSQSRLKVTLVIKAEGVSVIKKCHLPQKKEISARSDLIFVQAPFESLG